VNCTFEVIDNAKGRQFAKVILKSDDKVIDKIEIAGLIKQKGVNEK
jgi:hypothetical protein